ncbi:MAG TPA: threonine synthase [Microthrixaceae bacterium]|nr:threonine synthase [Microthrixaceae bacterium]
MKYVSTRGAAPALGFGDVLLSGLATDGGLYLPDSWPELPPLDELRGLTYPEVATRVMWPFVEGEIDASDFERIVAETYSVFDTPEVCPVVPLGETAAGAPLWLLELFRGPTLAFKDVALQLVGRLFDHVLTARGERICILGATSGDTGSAAIEACRDRSHLDIFVLFPDGRVSAVQRRQMTTVPSPNVHAVAVAGTFDDCQDLVKAAFADAAFRDEVRLSAVNSINWARVMAQVVYYVTAHLAVAPDGGPVSFVVPTGNFGNIFAGWAAKRMGLPVDRLVVASNRNDVLTRFFTTGTMEIREVVPTTSPSMDIQVSSNLERLLFEVLDRDGAAVASLMSRFREDGTVSVEAAILERLRDEFDCGRVDDESAAEVIRRTHGRRGMLLDPHTAVGVGIAEGLEGDPSVPVVSLATAHPAKFPDAVEAATGVRPELPPHLADLFEREERIERVPADLAAVESLVRSRIATA